MSVSSWTLLREALSTAVSSEAASNARDSERGAEPEAQAATDLAIMQRVQSGGNNRRLVRFMTAMPGLPSAWA